MSRSSVVRFALALVAMLGIALAASPAFAQEAEAPSAAPPSAEAPKAASTLTPCPANVKAVLANQLVGITSATCVNRVNSETKDVRTSNTLYQIDARVGLADGRVANVELVPDPTDAKILRIASVSYDHNDLSGSTSKSMAIVFWLFAAASVAGALFVITRRNLIAAVMGMVGSFLGISAVYMMLYAQFLAVIQMLVYAGAIMVLFVFVVMILNRPEDEPVAPSGRAGQVVGALAILYLVGRLVILLTHVEPPDPRIAREAPRALPAQCVEWNQGACVRAESPDWGSVSAVGSDLFGQGLFPFEAISILLLIAVVGAIAIARPLHAEDDAPAKARQEGAA